MQKLKVNLVPLVNMALALILKRPSLAMHQSVDVLLDRVEFDLLLLQEVVRLIRFVPDTTAPRLLGRFYGTPDGRRLSELEREELIIPLASVDQHFIDVIRALTSAPAMLDDMADKLRRMDYASLNETEKGELRDLLHEKLMRDKVNQGFA